MNYTTNYKLPQWVETDRIMMEDFNQMCADIDAGLTAIQETAKTANAAASEGAEKIGALETRVTAVEQAVKFVKLGGPVVTTTANQTVSFNLAGINMSEYTAVLFVVKASHSFGSVNLQVNGSSLISPLENNNSQAGAMVWLLPGDGKVLGFSQGCRSSSQTTGGTSSSGALALAWTAVSSISASGTSNAGMNCTLYGLKG